MIANTSGYLIYHPKRAVSKDNNTIIYHDAIRAGNQDPYIWSTRFLHTYCHITQLSPKAGHIIFWVSGNTFPHFSQLYCDLVFVVETKLYWSKANSIERSDPLVESDEAFDDHYTWHHQHPFKKRKRFTLKAHPDHSFQPQDRNGMLIDIVPLLDEIGLSPERVRDGLKAGFQSKPMHLDTQAHMLYEKVQERAEIKLYGAGLEKVRRGRDGQ